MVEISNSLLGFIFLNGKVFHGIHTKSFMNFLPKWTPEDEVEARKTVIVENNYVNMFLHPQTVYFIILAQSSST